MMGYKAQILCFPDRRFGVIETRSLGSIDLGSLARQVERFGDAPPPSFTLEAGWVTSIRFRRR